MAYEPGKTYEGKIVKAEITEARFDANALEIVFDVEIDGGEEPVSIFCEVSNRYGTGNLAGKTSSEITAETLRALGYEGGPDFSEVETLEGKSCRVYCKEKTSSKGTAFLNWYFSTLSGPRRGKSLSRDEAKARLAAMMKKASSSNENPFA